MKVLYIIGPYRADTVNGIFNNIQEARRRMEWALLNGYAPICPHNNTAFTDGLVPDEVILEADMTILRRCDAVLLIRGWRESEGSRAEVDLATRIGLEVIDDPL